MYPYLATFNELWLGFSGGMDSTVLLHQLQQAYPDKLRAVHINHQLQSDADHWQQHCEQLCLNWNVPFYSMQVDLQKLPQTSLEAEARRLRYAALENVIQQHGNSPRRRHCLLTAHHQSDQAETLLLQLMRGAGLAGLASMASLLIRDSGYYHARPLLATPYADLQAYAQTHQLDWINDPSNADTQYRRNALRQQIVPLLETIWPQATASIAKSAAHLQQSLAVLEEVAAMDAEFVVKQPHHAATLVIDPQALRLLSTGRQYQLMRWLYKQRLKINLSSTDWQRLQAIFNSDDKVIPIKPQVLPATQGQWRLHQQYLYYLTDDWDSSIRSWQDDAETMARAAFKQHKVIWPKQVVLTSVNMSDKLSVHPKQPRKTVKNLLQAQNYPVWLRPFLKSVYVNDQLRAVVGPDLALIGHIATFYSLK